MSDPVLDLIAQVIPVSPDDGCTVVEARPDGGVTWGHPVTVAALVRNRLVEAGLLLPAGGQVTTEWWGRWVHADGFVEPMLPPSPDRDRCYYLRKAARTVPGCWAEILRRQRTVWPVADDTLDPAEHIGPWVVDLVVVTDEMWRMPDAS